MWDPGRLTTHPRPVIGLVSPRYFVGPQTTNRDLGQLADYTGRAIVACRSANFCRQRVSDDQRHDLVTGIQSGTSRSVAINSDQGRSPYPTWLV
jgi:hypothetical protein